MQQLYSKHDRFHLNKMEVRLIFENTEYRWFFLVQIFILLNTKPCVKIELASSGKSVLELQDFNHVLFE